jgi:hypothetical protein
MPASAERSIQSVGAYLRDHEPNPVLRVKALHDWVADRIAWDPHDGAGDAGGAFARRRATRVGFAHLLAELSDAGGADIRFTTGMTYSEDHWRRTGRTAWNEVVLGDKTYSIDVALDAGALFYPRHARWPLFLKQYRTTYFLPSVATFAETHAADFSLAAWPHTNTSPVDHSALWFLADD